LSAPYHPCDHQGLVSVILAVHNREDSVGRAIKSVLTQTYPCVELIVVDDGSTDGTRSVVERFNAGVKLVSLPHAGVYAARNAGLRHARGKLIAFIDSDDAWFSDKLAAQVPLMNRPEIGLVFADVVHVTAPREQAPRTGLTSFCVAPPRRDEAVRGLLWCNFVPTSTVLVRRRCLDVIGGFSEASEVSADYLAWFRIALRDEFDYVERPLAEYTIHSGGISFDLGVALSARIALFSAELAQTDDPKTGAMLRRLIFNLSLHLALAAVRGRAGNVRHPLPLAWRTARNTAELKFAQWTIAFAANQLRTRVRRLFS